MSDPDKPVAATVPTQQGITSGPGNQGSANTAHMMGQAGTGLGKLSLPVQLKGGGTSVANP